MAQQIINVGASPNDGQGNPIRTSFTKCNENFGELYSRAQVTPPAILTGSVGDQAGMYAYDSVYFYYCFADYDGNSVIWGQVTQVGNISATQVAYGNSVLDIATPGANITVSVTGTSNVSVFSPTGLAVTGTTNVSGNLTGGNIQTVGSVSATGNIAGNYILANGYYLTGIPPQYSNANVNAYLPTYSGNITANIISASGNITSAANISTGNLLSSGIVSAAGNVRGGNINTAGQISASGNILTVGAVSATGNISAANYLYSNGTPFTFGPVLNITMQQNYGGF